MNEAQQFPDTNPAALNLEGDGGGVGESKRRLTSTFLLTGFFATVAIVSALTAGGYSVVRSLALQSTADRIANEMYDNVLTRVQGQQFLAQSKVREAVGGALLKISPVQEVALFDVDAKSVWASSEQLGLSERESRQFSIVSQGRRRPLLFDQRFFELANWAHFFSGSENSLSALIPLNDLRGERFGVAKILIDPQRDLRDARNFGLGVLLAVLLATLLLFFLLYRNFKKGIQTIEKQEQEMNYQIARLSNLLLVNKSMQKSMKTASARAVELNEQFLRRTGADLHDGPAQMIGFAAMRLNKLSKDEAVKSLGHEFHGIREALDQSLDEIRGISSGLVLPELASMTFEQCLRKVVLLHGTKSDAEVTQFHASVPDTIALPIKICAYRFVQEGLSNAERHGKAEKCRLRTSFRDGILEVSLKDNGMGFRKSQLSTDGAHLGLIGMKDRIESIGGKFSINSELGVGTALKFSVDVSDEL